MSPTSCHSYEVSAAAAHTARMIFRNFQLLPVGQYAPTEENIGKLVDVATQTFRLTAAVEFLSRNAPWWDADALQANMDRLRAAVEAVKQVRANMPSFPQNGDFAARAPLDELKPFQRYDTSAPALYGAKVILRHFQLQQRTTVQPTERNLAILIDVGTQVFRVETAVDYIIRRFSTLGSNELREQMLALRKALRVTEIMRNRTPHYDTPLKVTLHPDQHLEVRLTREQKTQAQRVGAAVMAARTADEQQDVLRRAGIVSSQ